jgi:hypothetical protein
MLASEGSAAATGVPRDDMRLISHNLDALLTSRTPAAPPTLDAAAAASAAVGGGAAPHRQEGLAGLARLYRSQSLELAEGEGLRPQSPLKRRGEWALSQACPQPARQAQERRHWLAPRAGGEACLGKLRRSSSSPLLQILGEAFEQQQHQQQQLLHHDSQQEPRKVLHPNAVQGRGTAAQLPSDGNSAQPEGGGRSTAGLRRLTSSHSEVTAGGCSPGRGGGASGGGAQLAGVAHDDLDWLLRQPSSAQDARDFDMLFGAGALCGDGSSSLLMPGSAGDGGHGGARHGLLLSPPAALFTSPRTRTGIFSPTYCLP